MIWGQLVEHKATGTRGRIAPFLNEVVVEFNEFFSDGTCIKVRTTPASTQELIESWRFVDIRKEICESCRGHGYFLFDGKNEVCYACLGNGYHIYVKTEENLNE